MKHTNRALALVLVLLMLLTAVPTALAAGSSKEATAGSSVNLSFTYSDVFGVDGNFRLDDPEGIVDSWKVTGYSGTGFGGSTSDASCFIYSMNATAGKVTVTVQVKLKSTAQKGKKATVIFNYSVTTDAMGSVSEYKDDKSTVTVIEKPVVQEPTPDPGPVVTIDYSVLEKQIAIANGLTKADYTIESWTAMQNALTDAKAALESKTQSTVDKAANALKSAIAALVPMDYSALQAVLALVQELIGKYDVGDLWMALADAVQRSEKVLTSGDQAAVDALTQEITDLIGKLEEILSVEPVPEIVIQEVEVEVPPKDDFCNIPMHKIWPILFFVSLGVNVLLGGAIVIVLSVRKKKHDDTPLVDYDIDDDLEGGWDESMDMPSEEPALEEPVENTDAE